MNFNFFVDYSNIISMFVSLNDWNNNNNNNTNNMNYENLKNVFFLDSEIKETSIKYKGRERTNGAKKSLFQRKSEQTFNHVANLIETNDFKLKRKLDRQAKREFFKNKRMAK